MVSFFFFVLPALKGMKWVALILTRGRAGLLEGAGGRGTHCKILTFKGEGRGGGFTVSFSVFF